MKRIGKILAEIETSIKQIDLFWVILKTLVLLTISYLLLFIIGVDPFYAFIPAAVYLLSSVFVESRIDNLSRVENRFKQLDEKLRTARDNRQKDNIVLDSLEEDIVENLKDVRISAFFSYSRLIVLVFLLVFSVATSLYLSSQDIKIIELDALLEEARKRMTMDEEEEDIENIDFTSTEESIMEVGNERIEVEINPVGMEFDFSDETEEADYDFSTSFPRDVFISSGASYEDDFTEEQQMLIQRYFDKKRT
jgi:hypothetical protein